jgi:hypothetical protein
LRDQLLDELAAVASPEDAATWARQAIERKNTLVADDAGAIEAAFQLRLTGLADGAFAEESAPPADTRAGASLPAAAALTIEGEAAPTQRPGSPVKRHPELPPLRHEELPPPRVHDLG